ncbi:glycerol dehydratase reactivase beta/small subunit family protein [Pseudonocardia sp. CA-142604]|uniref:glycerol dehydratase reactivase beta/small subunit family protein n=1 Tax=Pseudonocardia sp. CA-142604 TaxID=3240024 RepID=UPI003D92F61B
MKCSGPPSGVTENAEIPSVVVLRPAEAGAQVLREVCAGIEEEGVPTRVVMPSGDTDADIETVLLAHAAAQESRLDVGVALGVGAVVVHHAKLPERSPAQVVPAEAGTVGWRGAGRAAARIVKGLPYGEV